MLLHSAPLLAALTLPSATSPRCCCPRMAAATSESPPLCQPGTTAGKIEEAVCTVYGAVGTERVRKSLLALSNDVALDRPIGDSGHELMVQQANSYIDDLTAQPWHDAKRHKWVKQQSRCSRGANVGQPTARIMRSVDPIALS